MSTIETNKQQAQSSIFDCLSRRTFLKTTGALAATAAAAGVFFRTGKAHAAGVPAMDRSGTPDPLETDTTKVAVKYSVCLQCHSACGIKVKVSTGATPAVLNIRGNPFHPNAADDDERLVQDAKPVDDPSVLKSAGTICPKGQAGVEIIYNPYRILQPLKRVGSRGSGRWQSISYAQALSEIAQRVAPYWTRGPEPGYTPVDADYIDPTHKALGFKNNQVALYIGRLEHGQKEFSDRWFKSGFGSANSRLDHTSTCETSHHVALYEHTANKKNHTKPDFAHAKFVLVIGTNLLEAGFPQQAASRKIARALKSGLKLAVADPRLSKAASKAVAGGGYWLPLIPGSDAALCFAIMRSWLDNSPSLETDAGNQIDSRFLRNATRGQAEADGEVANSDATFLVRRSDGTYLKDAGGKFMVWDGTQGVSVGTAPHKNTATPAHGLLLTGAAGVTVDGQVCDAVFQLLVNEIKKRTVAEWAALTGVEAGQLASVASDMASAGKQAGVEFYRGPVQHTNGTHNGLACATLNTLRGNYDVKGGVSLTGGGHWHEDTGGGVAGSVPIMTVAGAYKPVGPRFDRAGAKWEDYKGSETAPKRPWFPLAKYGNWQEVIPSIGAAYPYPLKALFTYWADPLYTTPGGIHGAAILKDEVALPLFVAFDNDFGATASLADYIIPDTTYLERWSTPHTAPAILSKVSGFRQPMVGQYKTPSAPKFDEWQAAVGNTWQYEDIWVGLAKQLETLTGRTFPGIGANGLAAGRPLESAWHWYDAILDNFSVESGVSKASIQAHGGVFELPGKEYTNNTITRRFNFSETLRLYLERLAKTADTFVDPTGATKFFPLPRYDVTRDVLDREVDDNALIYPFIGVTYKAIQHKQAVTQVCPTLMMVQPTNYVEMAVADARSLGLENGDLVKLTTPSNPNGVTGQVRATEGIRPGVLAVSMSFGHPEASSKPHMIDGTPTGFDRRRGRGVNTNAIARLDPVLGDVGLQDKVGGSVCYSATRIRVEKVAV